MTSKEKTNALINFDRELVFQKVEKGKRAAELVTVNEELAFQSSENERRTAELVVAGEQKEKRAAELVIAGKELMFQSNEKEQRAAELVIANKELVFQNEEKEKRAAELVIANRELIFQSNEKEQRAAELIIANEELVFQNEEKEKRAIELSIANRSLEQFAYIASHDLQEPLRTISNYVQILREEYLDLLDENARIYMQSINNATERMSMLVHSLLDFSRLGFNKKLAHVNCNSLVKSVIEDIQFIVDTSQATIDVAPLPSLNVYEVEMGQLFQNLITNAIKFQPENSRPEIKIYSRRVGDNWQFSVSDNGIGIDPDYFERIFDIFQRLHTRDEYKGSGIGLANCKKIVEMHKGEIWIESTLGKGTIFNFNIPNQLL